MKFKIAFIIAIFIILCMLIYAKFQSSPVSYNVFMSEEDVCRHNREVYKQKYGLSNLTDYQGWIVIKKSYLGDGTGYVWLVTDLNIQSHRTKLEKIRIDEGLFVDFWEGDTVKSYYMMNLYNYK